jgi:hypothetical protein
MSTLVQQFSGDFQTLLDHLVQLGRSADAIGYVAASLTVVTYSMKTMIPLRAIGIAANCLFIAYGFFASAYPQLLLHSVLLPLNCVRLYQMVRLVTLVERASKDSLSMDWVRSFTTSRRCRAGEMVFARGDRAEAMYYAVSGRYLLVEIDVGIGPGDVVGEMGLVAPSESRTQSFKCVEDGELLVITYAQVKQLYFQNPRVGFFFLNLITQRLFANYAKVEKRLQDMTARVPDAC